MIHIAEVPAVRIVDEIITEALSKNASDIHCESIKDGVRIRFRIDGVLYERVHFHGELAPQILARIKVLAHIDLAERRMPHDGKFRFQGQHGFVDMRVSTFPSVYGEKIVIRILDRFALKTELDQLGFSAHMLQQFRELIMRQNSCILVTGPTGSGKTITLYAALAELVSPEKNMVTLEDPVEYYFDGITQGQTHAEIGFTFAKGIRALLRQDPDIIMVGEIRDKETASVAVQAALTGHLLLSTLHTNDAPSAIIRLLDMGVEPFLLKATLAGIVAQRLARRLCTQCRYQDIPNDDELRLIERFSLYIHHLWRAPGCTFCSGLGYKGRIGIFELLVVSKELRSLISEQTDLEVLMQQALKDGMRSLRDDAAEKVVSGAISFFEMMRVVL
jgi:type II secretory ATPase GspE/PulE/Tfp pilus assembly ATPase PilB-like protein